MSDETITKIKDAIDIAELIGDTVRLTKKGRSYSGLCPFHDEKTPSFIVSPDRGTWHCFGCGKGGDIFTFVMLKEGLSFPEALEYLARRAGIPLPRRRDRTGGGDLYSVMESAINYYRNELKAAAGAVGRGYLKRRNITPEDARRFELGWAPASWRSLNDALRKSGITGDQLLKCGLVIQGDRGVYDRFRGRVIFPIRNVSGRPIALGGRIVDGEGAKYLNSPEGPLYNKKNNLYLLDKAKNAIREKKRSILVEGYMDAIRLHLHGHTETVASLGTSLTEEQAALLKRFSDRCYICYDSDAAGQHGNLRGMYILQRAGLQVFVVQFPGGKDPDEMLQTETGDAEFDKALDEALPLVRYHISLFKEAAKKDGETRAAEDLLTGMAQLPPVELAPYMQEIAHAVGIPGYQLADELNRMRRGRPMRAKPAERTSESEVIDVGAVDGEEEQPFDVTESGAVYLLWSSPGLRKALPAGDTLRLIRDGRLQTVAAALLTGTMPEELESQWLQIGDTRLMGAIAGGGNFCDTLSGTEAEKWQKISADLLRHVRTARYRQLLDVMLRGNPTDEERAEYAQLASKIKNF